MLTGLELFLSKESTFLYIGLTFAHFKLSGKDSVFNASFTYTHFYGLCGYSVTRNFAFNFKFFLYCLYTSVKGDIILCDFNIEAENKFYK